MPSRLFAAQTPRPQAPGAAPVVTLPALFIAFLKVSLLGFGGGLVWARRMVVDRQRWLDDQDFADLLSLCQFMPGPNIASITVCVGAKLRGAPGAAVALAGFILIPWTVGFAIGTTILGYAHHPMLRNILGGVSAAAAGLLIATGLRLLLPHRGRPIALLVAAIAFAGLVVAKLPLLVVVVVLAPLSIGAARFEGVSAR
jgi:chromate transporter